MTDDQFLTYASWALYLGVFVVVVLRALRLPTRAHLDMVLFFGASALIIVVGTVDSAMGLTNPVWLNDVVSAALMALPYLLLRLVDDFAGVPVWVLRAAQAGLVLSVLGLVALPQPVPTPAALAMVGYFLLLAVYDTAIFVREAVRFHGVTRRRMQAIALGSGFLGLVIVAAGLGLIFPEEQGFWGTLGRLSGLGSGVAYFVGFVPPSWLRRVWQEPELRAFLRDAALLPRLPDMRSVVLELQRRSGEVIGVPGMALGLLSEAEGILRFPATSPDAGALVALQPSEAPPNFAIHGDTWDIRVDDYPPGRRVLATQQPLFVPDMIEADPGNAAQYRAFHVGPALVAPISASEKSLGILVAYAPREPFFAQSDLELIQLLADQAAVILESRALIDQAAQVQAREETARLKEDFLSSAAHDLKTPLTGMITSADLLLRRAQRDPEAPADTVLIQRIVGEGRRLQAFILDLLDASRMEHSALVELDRLERMDLAELARELCAADRGGRDRCSVEAHESVPVNGDPTRVRQLLENLVENALKYSDQSSPVQLRVWRQGDEAHLTVTDHGIGIPAEDQPHVFDRFYRARNADHRRHAGLGLGLYICRGIAEQHAGRLWVESTPGQGSTFHLVLPLDSRQPDVPVPDVNAPARLVTSTAQANDSAADPQVSL